MFVAKSTTDLSCNEAILKSARLQMIGYLEKKIVCERAMSDESIISNNKHLSINMLPDEMLVKIFSYLNINDLCFTIGAVCVRWKLLTNERTLWKNVKCICSNNMSLDYIVNVLRHCSLLQAIVMQWRTDVDDIVKELISSCESIGQVYMVCCGKVKADTMEVLFDNYPLLEYISLEKCWTVQDDCYHVIHKFANLKSVNISHGRNFTGDMLKELIDCCPLLVHINMDYIHGITDDDLLYLTEMKKHNLLSLILFGESLTDASFISLQKCTQLKKLHFSKCVLMNKKGLQSIGKLTNLRSLKLRFGVNLSPERLIDFLLSRAVRELEYLCLSRSENFTDDAATAVAENCKQLKQLDVVHCPNLTETGRQTLLINCEKLEKLNFSEDSLLASEIVIAR